MASEQTKNAGATRTTLPASAPLRDTSSTKTLRLNPNEEKFLKACLDNLMGGVLIVDVAKVSAIMGHANARSFFTNAARVGDKMGVRFASRNGKGIGTLLCERCAVNLAEDPEWEDEGEWETDDVEIDLAGGVCLVRK